MKLLHLDSSILGGHSASRQVSHDIVERLRGEGGTVEVIHRDLVADPLPHLVLANLPSRHRLAAEVDDAAKHAFAADRAESDRVLQEFVDADIIVVGAPLYNFSVPSQLKADHALARHQALGAVRPVGEGDAGDADAVDPIMFLQWFRLGLPYFS